MTDHDAEEVIGRITKAGRWDRRYRIQHAAPEPVKVDPLRTVAEILIGAIVILALFVGILMWVAIAGAAA